jgi:peptide/nickel transport system permease protein
MLKYVIRRLAISIGVLWSVSTATFFVLHLTGDPVTAALEQTGASPADIARVKHQLGFDRPIFDQYGSFLHQALAGNFGRSFEYGTSASGVVLKRLPYTLELTGAALGVTLLVAVPLAVIAAYRHDRLADRAILFAMSAGQSIPAFVVGPVLILIFAVWIRGLLPAAGANSPSAIILPTASLALFPIARVVRVLRVSVLDVIQSDYVRTARAKGVSEVTIAAKHVTRNALLPAMTIVSLQAASLLGGAVVVENIFSWPGIGTLAEGAFTTYDFALSQAIVIVVALMVISVNLVTDIAYAIIDPRIRLR